MLLHPAHVAQAHRAAKGRSTKTRRSPGYLLLDPTRSQEEVDRAALEGEAAVALLVGGEADFRQRPGGDEGYDLLAGDLRVEVKHTRHRGGWLFVSTYPIHADILVLTTPGRHGGVEIRGWTTRREFYAKARKKDFGHGERRAMRQEDLRAPLELIQRRVWNETDALPA